MKSDRLALVILLTALLFGCSAPKPSPDPLAGWKLSSSQDPYKIKRAIREDYQEYIQMLPPVERKAVGPIHFLEDSTGQNAVKVEIALSGTNWSHVLIYDGEGKRLKVIKYISGHYRS